jgi:hypothetical protein
MYRRCWVQSCRVNPLTEALTRCRAGQCCTAGEDVHDDAGEHLGRLGAVTDAPLCEDCTRTALVAIRNLPDDMIELNERLMPSGAMVFHDPEMPSPARVKKAAPLPFDEYVYTLMELVDYETTLWVESVADAEGFEWDSSAAEHSRRQFRVEKACELLADRIQTLVQLPAQQHRAHSLTADPSDGHNPDTTTRYRGDYWSNREGWEAALRFIELHRLAEHHIGKRARNHIQVPCPGCNEQRLEREHHNDRVICRQCDLRMSDDDYDSFIEHALATVGQPGDVLTRSQAALLAGVRPGTIRKWVQRGFLRPLPGGKYRRIAVLEAINRNSQVEGGCEMREAAVPCVDGTGVPHA